MVDVALYADLAIHAFDEGLCDRESKPGSFGRRVIRRQARKALEEQIALLVGDADSRIDDAEAKAFGRPGHTKREAALVREFHGIVQEIDDGLLQPLRVDHDGRGNVIVDLEARRQFLLDRRRADHVQAYLAERFQVELIQLRLHLVFTAPPASGAD